jgi:hypothetical protein
MKNGKKREEDKVKMIIWFKTYSQVGDGPVRGKLTGIKKIWVGPTTSATVAK